MEFSDNNRVKLFPVLIRPFGENFRILRWGGKSKILTRQFGVDAIHLLKKGRTIGEVKKGLGEKYNIDPLRVDLKPLLHALLQAQFIRQINGRSSGQASQVTIKSVIWFIWRFYLSPFLRKFGATCLPLAVSRHLGFWTHFLDLKKAMKPALDDAARNMATIWPDVPAREISRLQAEFYHNWIWNVVDVEMFETRKAATVDRWMGKHMTVKGIEHLDRAREDKNGVILCVFHFSSTRPIPLLLMKHGYPVAAIGPANMGWGTEKTMDVLRKFKAQLPEYASLRLFGDFNLQNLRSLVDALKGGEVATCMADVIPGPPSDQDAVTRERMNYFRLTSQGFPRASASVTFMDQRIDMTAWVGWLAAISGATILPTMMLRKPNKGLELRIEPPMDRDEIEGTAKADIQRTVNAWLYRALERYVNEYPAQWFAWHNLHRVGLQRAKPTKSVEECQAMTVSL
jgi:lauroyl/myristoyl acyltransferase